MRAVCAALSPCGVFADIGCDHGFFTEYMLEENLCERAYISDISAKCLRKAENLLREHIAAGRVKSFCCAGFDLVPRDTEEALIAGMGGDETADILEAGFFPPVLVLQPMRNTVRVRRLLLSRGYAITTDRTVRDGKFYDILRAERDGVFRGYGEAEIVFGYDNLHAPEADFFEYIQVEKKKCRMRMDAAGKPVEELAERYRMLSEAENEAGRNLREN